MSGLPSQGKKKLFISVLTPLAAGYKVLVLVQNRVGTSLREEVSRMKSLIASRLTKDTLVAVYAPLHIKSVRYEISAIARSLGAEAVHLLYKSPVAETGSLLPQDLPDSWEVVSIPTAGKAEEYDALQRVFEYPRESDKWDAPVFVATDSDADAHALICERLLAAVTGEKKQRKCTTRLLPLQTDKEYLRTVKQTIDEVLAEKAKVTYVPLKTLRDIEEGFIQSISLNFPPLASIPSAFYAFVEAYLGK